MIPPEQYTYPIRHHETDAHGNLFLGTLSHFLQDAAWTHAETHGFGLSHLPPNHGWMMTRLLIKLEECPQWQEQLVLETWASGVERLLAYRDFELFLNGVSIGKALWVGLMVNLEARRAARIPPAITDLVLPDKPTLRNPTDYQPLPPFERVDFSHRFVVQYHDVDAYQHTNNAAYIKQIVESLPHLMEKEQVCKSLDIAFKAESTYQTQAEVQTQQLDAHTFLHRILRLHDEKVLVEAKTVWHHKP